MPKLNILNPKYRWLMVLLFIPALLVAAVIGFVVFAVVLGLVLIAGTGILLRLWWLRRKLRKTSSRQVLQGDYRVVREREHEPRDPPRP